MKYWSKLSLTQRLADVFCVLLLACCAASAWLQIRASDLREREVVQGLSRGLAGHIAHDAALMDVHGVRSDAVHKLFMQLMVVNPSVEVYLLDKDGNIKAHDAPPGHLLRGQVDMEPVRRFISGDPLPILGDDPRGLNSRKVFSAAPLVTGSRERVGYVYVVLLGEEHDELAARVAASGVLRTTLAYMALVTLLALVAGLVAFGLITRPLRRLTDAMRRFDANGAPDEQPVVPRSPATTGDEIAVLESTFEHMAARIGEQWRALKQQDRERREMIANISHDLRTPLSSLHGYLETVSLKADLSVDDRQRYLGIALAQSARVGRLAQALFELARLEHGMVELLREAVSLPDLVQDVFEKFGLAAEEKALALRASIPPRLPFVIADVAMLERVLTNLLDNAIRHTPHEGEVEVVLAQVDDKVLVTISDTGPGIPEDMRDVIFQRPFRSTGLQRNGGLGLLIVQRMLQLHGSQIRLIEREGRGTTFEFELAIADVPHDVLEAD